MVNYDLNLAQIKSGTVIRSPSLTIPIQNIIVGAIYQLNFTYSYIFADKSLYECCKDETKCGCSKDKICIKQKQSGCYNAEGALKINFCGQKCKYFDTKVEQCKIPSIIPVPTDDQYYKKIYYVLDNSSTNLLFSVTESTMRVAVSNIVVTLLDPNYNINLVKNGLFDNILTKDDPWFYGSRVNTLITDEFEISYGSISDTIGISQKINDLQIEGEYELHFKCGNYGGISDNINLIVTLMGETHIIPFSNISGNQNIELTSYTYPFTCTTLTSSSNPQPNILNFALDTTGIQVVVTNVTLFVTKEGIIPTNGANDQSDSDTSNDPYRSKIMKDKGMNKNTPNSTKNTSSISLTLIIIIISVLIVLGIGIGIYVYI